MAAVIDLPQNAGLPAVEGLRLIRTILTKIDGGSLVELDAPGITGFVAGITQVINQLQAIRLKGVAAADLANAAASTGQANTGAWLAGVTNTSGREAAGAARLAKALDGDCRLTGDALSAGTVSPEHADVITGALGKLPTDITPREREQIEAGLIRRAKTVDPATLRKESRRALEHAHRPTREVDAAHADALETEEHQALQKTRLSIRDNCDGTSSGWFQIPTYGAHLLRKLVQELTSPRRNPTRGTNGTDAKGTNADGAHRPDGDRQGACGTDPDAAKRVYQDTDWAHEYGLAFLQLIEHLPTDRLHGKTAATILVTIDHAKLVEDLGAAHLDTGLELSPTQTRRLGCQAGILPAILGTRSEVLDLGRATRLFSETQRIALATTYISCATLGCHRPFAWSEIHHEQWWSKDGRTDLANAIPLCGYHHRLIHAKSHSHTITESSRSNRKIVTFTQRAVFTQQTSFTQRT